jgi:hypothetical protein
MCGAGNRAEAAALFQTALANVSACSARGAAPGRSQQRLGLHFQPDADKDPDTNQSQVQQGAREAAINHHMGYIPTIPHEL